jgi:hypothetical protein
MGRSREMQEVLDFCLEHAEAAPICRRVSLYRGLAEFCGDEDESREFLRQAEALERSEARFSELRFRLGRKAPGRQGSRRKGEGRKGRRA